VYKRQDYTYSLNGLAKTVRIPAGLKRLLEYRPPALEKSLVSLETLITRLNYTSIPRVAALSKDLSLSLHLETPIYTGRAIDNYRQLELSPAQYRHLHEQLADILGADLLEALRTQQCPVERNPVVWTNGDIAFCSSRGGPVGNVRDEPLARLFAKAKRLKHREDARLTRGAPTSRYFHTCPSRRYYEVKYGLVCNY